MMPHIVPIFSEVDTEVLEAIRANKDTLCEALHRSLKVIDGDEKTRLDEIALYPQVLSALEHALSHNIDRLTFVIEVGKREVTRLCDNDADMVSKHICGHCPELREIEFGVWIREYPSNGYSAHAPHDDILTCLKTR